MKSQSIEENLELVQKILLTKNVEELRTFGTYLEVKTIVESTLCVKLGVRSWQSLMAKLKMLKTRVIENKDKLKELSNNCQSLLEFKKAVGGLLSINITAKSMKAMLRTVDVLCGVFKSRKELAVAHFEKTKLENFRESSRLESLDIIPPTAGVSLNSVLDKYSKASNG